MIPRRAVSLRPEQSSLVYDTPALLQDKETFPFKLRRRGIDLRHISEILISNAWNPLRNSARAIPRTLVI